MTPGPRSPWACRVTTLRSESVATASLFPGHVNRHGRQQPRQPPSGILTTWTRICKSVHTTLYMVQACMYMFMIFNNCIMMYHVCQLLYYSIVHTLYIHCTDMSVHVYVRWSGFQMILCDVAYDIVCACSVLFHSGRGSVQIACAIVLGRHFA